MIRSFVLQLGLVFIFLVSGNVTLRAQAILPDIMVITQNGVNIASWVSQYEGLKSIAVQRSSDSVYNFATIGYVKNLKKGNQAFIDGHPNPGTNWYRLYIVFSSDLTWYSNTSKSFVDSSEILKKGVLPPNDSLQKMVGDLNFNNTLPDASELNAYTYIRSQYVFTNPFTGHVNVELPDNEDKKASYSLKFFDQKDKLILGVPKVSQHSVIIDKRNFQRRGLYKFELRKGADVLESGFITIY